MITAIMQTPTAQIPLNIPYPVPIHNLVQPPPLPQLKPYGVEPVTTQLQINTTPMPPPPPPPAPFIPVRIKARLDELGVTEEMFEDLLKIYESVRDEYIDLTKKVKRYVIPNYLHLQCSAICETPRYVVSDVKKIRLAQKLAVCKKSTILIQSS